MSEEGEFGGFKSKFSSMNLTEESSSISSGGKKLGGGGGGGVSNPSIEKGDKPSSPPRPVSEEHQLSSDGIDAPSQSNHGDYSFEAEETMLKHITTKGFNRKQKTSSPTNPPPKSSHPPTNLISQQIMGSNGQSDTQVPLPQRFVVKYLGFRETHGLWGIKYTRNPVDEMVADAKKVLSSNAENSLPLLKLEVSEDGILVGAMPQNTNPNFPSGRFAIESISYGVQDLVFTRVFGMIVVKSEGSVRVAAASQNHKEISQTDGTPPFRCHAFVCDSRNTARNLTFSLATAFQKFSENVASGKVKLQKPKRFAIDLRTSKDLEADLVDSEA